MSAVPPLDPVSIAAVLATLVVGPVLGMQVGPYIVMFVASFIGAMVGLRRRNPSDAEHVKMPAVLFVMAMMAWAMTVSIPLSLGAVKMGLSADWKWVLFPVTFVVGALGENWVGIGKWFIGVCKSAAEGAFQK